MLDQAFPSAAFAQSMEMKGCGGNKNIEASEVAAIQTGIGGATAAMRDVVAKYVSAFNDGRSLRYMIRARQILFLNAHDDYSVSPRPRRSARWSLITNKLFSAINRG
jgi:hypothetical protein